MRVALYARTSTTDQDCQNQLRVLREVASRRGWSIIEEYVDHGFSGAKDRSKRPAFGRLCKDAARRKFDMVAAWAIDRLGRSVQHVAAFIVEMDALGIGLYLDQQAIDSSTPTGKAMLQMCAVFGELERALIRERVLAGLARAKERGTRSGRPIGRQPLSQDKVAAVREALARGDGIRAVARAVGISPGSVANIRDAQQ
jgi:DNA invertase Pin-like site-specific DNA recombinase